MKKARFEEEQIIAILWEHEAGAATSDVCRKHGIGSATFYKWKAKPRRCSVRRSCAAPRITRSRSPRSPRPPQASFRKRHTKGWWKRRPADDCPKADAFIADLLDFTHSAFKGGAP